jgi:hypothetical protein
VTESSEGYELSNVVETALARALTLAAEAGRWNVVAQIAQELQGRRVSARTVPRAEGIWLGAHLDFVSRLAYTSNLYS